MEKTMNRRTFIGAAGAAGAGIVAAGALASSAHADEAAETAEVAEAAEAAASNRSWRIPPDPVDPSEIVATYDTEIGIVGLGHAGLTTLRAAAEGGAQVVVVEMQADESWWTIGHDIGHLNSEFLRSFGVPDVDPGDYVNTHLLLANGKANPALVSCFAQRSGETIDWLLDKCSQELIDSIYIAFFPDNEYTIHDLNNGLHFWSSSMEIWPSRKAALESTPIDEEINVVALNNTPDYFEAKDIDRQNLDYVLETYPDTVTMLWETKGYYLLKDGDRVTGFIANGPDGYVQVNCSKAVVLAGGGFGTNEEMRNDLLPWINQMLQPETNMTCMFDRDGSAISMGVWAGGRLEPEVSTMGFDTVFFPDTLLGPLWVDDSGQRFQNEAFAGEEVTSFFMVRAKRGHVTSIFDNTLERQLNSGLVTHDGVDWSNGSDVPRLLYKFQSAEGMGAEGYDGYYCADTLDELADYIGFDETAKEAFLAGIDRYNELCAKGVDDDFGKDPHFMLPVENPPFYAHVTDCNPAGAALVTVGGFVTDNNQCVVDEYYRPIEGLYATGNCCGLRFGPAYITPVSGVSLGMCYTLGRALGEHLAAL